MNHWCFSFHLSTCLCFYLPLPASLSSNIPAPFDSYICLWGPVIGKIVKVKLILKNSSRAHSLSFTPNAAARVGNLWHSKTFWSAASLEGCSVISQSRSDPWVLPSFLNFLSLCVPSHSLALKMSLLGWSMHNKKILQKQVWLHQICQAGSLSLESFPQWAAGKLSKTILLWMQMNPFELHFMYVGVYGCQSPLRFWESCK